MEKLELNDFYNGGFGWICKHCERELESQTEVSDKKTSRLMTEGETESKHPKLSSPALAKWADAAQRILVCPRCGITELADKF
jgi:rubrerythrin